MALSCRAFLYSKKGEMQMTILDEILIEEYNRMESHRRAFVRVLEENPNDERKDKIRQQIERIEFDQRKSWQHWRLPALI